MSWKRMRQWLMRNRVRPTEVDSKAESPAVLFPAAPTDGRHLCFINTMHHQQLICGAGVN